MRVTMIRTQTGSPDGIHVNTYVAGQVYDLNLDLARAFLSMGVAVDEAQAEIVELADVPLPEIPEPKGERRRRVKK